MFGKLYKKEREGLIMENRDIKPGEFKEIAEDEYIPEESGKEEPEIYFSDELIALYTAFKNQVYKPESVLYPSSGFDASPAKVFDNVTFVDVEDGNEGCIRKLQEAGFKALKQDIREYSPKKLHDLLILLNPSISTEWASRHLKSGGYILANNYHGNASEMYRQPDEFTLWGVMDFAERDRRKGDNRVIISRNLENLFQPVENAVEFQRLRPDDFEFTRDMVLSFVKEGYVKVDTNASFEEKWAAYRKTMREGMPSKRVADRYIFIKN